MSDAVEGYLRALSDTRNTGAATRERSHYGALQNLLAAVGASLAPKVLVVGELEGAVHPDFGLFTQTQARGNQDLKGQKPERGVVEVKSTGEEVSFTAATRQVSKYWTRHRLVLVTNYRDFLLVGEDEHGQPAQLEPFRLAQDEAAFWALADKPAETARHVGARLAEYLRRMLSYQARIRDSKELAWFLASYARDALSRVEEQRALPALAAIRADLEEALGIRFEGAKGEHFFRSTLIQTLFYGLFSAWVLWARGPPAAKARFDWRTSQWHLHLPVIRSLFGQIASPTHLTPLKLDEVLTWASDALNRIDQEAFFSRFQESHAVQYFYEPFLEAYDPALRKELGVWYTPPEVVEYMVAQVDRALREELKVEGGLANKDVIVLDPCTGTGSFMVEVLRRIEATWREQGDGALAALEVKKAATERVFGFEIMPAPFVVAHLQIGMHLRALGAPLEAATERAQLFLTNALTGWEPPDEKKQRVLPSPEFQQEREAADQVKQREKIIVILGNPPYNGFAEVKVGEERALSEAYREVERVRPPEGQGLNNLYVRFFRMAERRIAERSGKGIVCFISDYGWLDGLSFTGMRERYLDVFDEISIDCLNGDSRKTGKRTPEGEPDPSIFSTPLNREGIRQGTAIALLTRKEKHTRATSVRFRHFWGTSKLQQLAEAARRKRQTFDKITPALELGLPFVPSNIGRAYSSWPLLTELMPKSFPGVKTSRDSVVVDIDRDALIRRMKLYFDPEVSDAEIRKDIPDAMKTTARFDPIATRRSLCSRPEGMLLQNVVRYAYRPFDLRWIYWEPEKKLLDEKRADYWPQVFDGNVWIEARERQIKEAFTRGTLTSHLADNFGNGLSHFFPALLKGDGASNSKPRPNVSREAAQYLQASSATPSDLFRHILATLHAPAYRAENASALRQDWPRIPLPEGAEALRRSAELGKRLEVLLDPESSVETITSGKLRPELRLMGSPRRADGKPLGEKDLALTADWGRAGQGGACMPGNGRTTVRPWTADERKALSQGAAAHGLTAAQVFELLGESAVDVWLNGEAQWAAVPSRVWDYTLGGYQVVKKWLSYREQALLGRALRIEEVREVAAMVRRIAALLLLQPALDASYADSRDHAGRWPAPEHSAGLVQARDAVRGSASAESLGPANGDLFAHLSPRESGGAVSASQPSNPSRPSSV